jgi:predicted CXXCH cytochrome family protein
MSFKNGESLSVSVDEPSLKSSAHGKLRCTECHADFSKSKHPVRVFASRRNYSIVTSDMCGRCHADANTKYNNSIHHALLKSANLMAPACTGCHGFHTVTKAGKDLGLVSCNKCHQDMKSSYEASIHNKARMKGNQNAPMCSSCHNAHDVQSTKMTAKIKDACLACHKNAEDKHKKWLYNPPLKLRTFTELHFNTVACAACHAPDAGRGIYLNLYDRKTGKPFPEEELLKLFDTDAAGLMSKIDMNKDGSIDSVEAWNLFKYLFTKGASTTLIGKMDVSTATEAHNIADKTKAVKDCGACHNPDSPFFKDVFLVIRKADGRPTVFNAKQDVLGKDLKSVYAIVPTTKFYVLGSTNLKLWDILFIVALIGGIAVPIGHLTLRIITSPLRALRSMKKGGKK